MARTKATLHRSASLACGHHWTGDDGIAHLCRAHVLETDECLCPCGARTVGPDANLAPHDPPVLTTAAALGSRGGKARAAALTADQRRAIARKAGQAPKTPRARTPRAVRITFDDVRQTWFVRYVTRAYGQPYHAAQFDARDHSRAVVEAWVAAQPDLTLTPAD